MTEPESSTPPTARLPHDVPNVYADNVMDCIYGVYTTKVVFGVEQGGAAPARPTAVVTIPTTLLFAAALQMVRDISNPWLTNEVKQRSSLFAAHAETVAAAVSAAANPDGSAP